MGDHFGSHSPTHEICEPFLTSKILGYTVYISSEMILMG